MWVKGFGQGKSGVDWTGISLIEKAALLSVMLWPWHVLRLIPCRALPDRPRPLPEAHRRGVCGLCGAHAGGCAQQVQGGPRIHDPLHHVVLAHAQWLRPEAHHRRRAPLASPTLCPATLSCFHRILQSRCLLQPLSLRYCAPSRRSLHSCRQDCYFAAHIGHSLFDMFCSISVSAI